jgi:hypothetical protein
MPTLRTAFILSALALSACMPTVPARDDGDPSFVRQAVPALLGRNPLNYLERKFFSEVTSTRLSPTDGRRGLVRGLMQAPAFADRFSEFLLRQADVDRAGSLAGCFGAPTRPPDPLLNQQLASTAARSVAPTTEFNGSDLLAATFARPESDVSPFLRMNMFASHAARSPFASQDAVAAQLQQTYLDRQTDCMGCHNSLFATTNTGSGWKRHYPMLGYFELALYGDHDGPEALSDVTNAFRIQATSAPAACVGTGCAGPDQPWSRLSRACGVTRAPSAIGAASGGVRFGSLSTASASLWDVEAMFKSGIDGMRGAALHRTSGPGDLLCTNCPSGEFEAIVRDTCMSCHNPTRAASYGTFYFELGSTPEALSMVWPGSSVGTPARDAIDFIADMVTSDQMPPDSTGISDAERDRLSDVVSRYAAQVAGGPPCTCSASAFAKHVAPDEAFAFLSGANFVNGVWRELFGRPLTTPNHFPRTAATGGALEALTQRFVGSGGWSLRGLLEGLYLSRFYNRMAPEAWPVGSDVTTHFEVPPVYDVWTHADPRAGALDATGTHNAMTEAIRRRPVRTLLASASAALGWPMPERFPTSQLGLHRGLGDELSAAEPGTTDATMQNLLGWEAYAGTCRSPTGAADFVDALSSAASSAGASREDALLTLKDRLIGEPWLDDASERSALATVFGALDAPFTLADRDRLRGVCGALLTSPQFMLQGLVPSRGHADVRPPLTVCLPGEPCSPRAVCEAWRTSFERAGYNLTCPKEFSLPVEIVPVLELDISRFVTVCTDRSCGFLPAAEAKSCRVNPKLCAPVQNPVCDTRCGGFDCCGASLHDIDRGFVRDGDGLLFTVAAGAKVQEAKGVTFGEKGAPVEPGSVLAAGDVLRFAQGARFVAEGPFGVIKTDPDGLKFSMKREFVELLITDLQEPKADDEDHWESLTPGELAQREAIRRLYPSRKDPVLRTKP